MWTAHAQENSKVWLYPAIKTDPLSVCFENCLSPKRGQALFTAKHFCGHRLPCAPALGVLSNHRALCSLPWAKIVNKCEPGLFWRTLLSLTCSPCRLFYTEQENYFRWNHNKGILQGAALGCGVFSYSTANA